MSISNVHCLSSIAIKHDGPGRAEPSSCAMRRLHSRPGPQCIFVSLRQPLPIDATHRTSSTILFGLPMESIVFKHHCCATVTMACHLLAKHCCVSMSSFCNFANSHNLQLSGPVDMCFLKTVGLGLFVGARVSQYYGAFFYNYF